MPDPVDSATSGSGLSPTKPPRRGAADESRPIATTDGRWIPAFAYLNVSDPLVAWLAYRGEMVSAAQQPGALSFWMTRYLAEVRHGRRADVFRAEVELENIRRHSHPSAVSRLGGFYVFPDKGSATRASSWGRAFAAEFLAEVALRPGSRTSRYDAQWISHKLNARSDLAWVHDYLHGRAYGDQPIWETIVDGRALILGTELRERAYETVKTAWPDSLALLELARIGTELDSDLGLIAARIHREDGNTTVKYAMNFADATNAAFLARLGAFEGPKNVNDLKPDSELVVPDLRDRWFSL